jgi:choline dehydrogenase
MLSGVGVATELQAYGIVPRADLPVGENLQDHVQPPVHACRLHRYVCDLLGA